MYLLLGSADRSLLTQFLLCHRTQSLHLPRCRMELKYIVTHPVPDPSLLQRNVPEHCLSHGSCSRASSVTGYLFQSTWISYSGVSRHHQVVVSEALLFHCGSTQTACAACFTITVDAVSVAVMDLTPLCSSIIHSFLFLTDFLLHRTCSSPVTIHGCPWIPSSAQVI